MRKRIYISADYDEDNGDREVVDVLRKWGSDNLHKVDFIDMSEVKSGSVSKYPDCRICDLKREFNEQINASSFIIFIVGDKTASRIAGNSCSRMSKAQSECFCTPYKENVNGQKPCKVSWTKEVGEKDDVGNINSFSYLEHEFKQAEKHKRDKIIILYNSLRHESNWLPDYMADYESEARPFWIKNSNGDKVGDYEYIKQVLEDD